MHSLLLRPWHNCVEPILSDRAKVRVRVRVMVRVRVRIRVRIKVRVGARVPRFVPRKQGYFPRIPDVRIRDGVGLAVG